MFAAEKLFCEVRGVDTFEEKYLVREGVISCVGSRCCSAMKWIGNTRPYSSIVTKLSRVDGII